MIQVPEAILTNNDSSTKVVIKQMEKRKIIEDNKINWMYFEADKYILKTKVVPGQDAFARNKFNQEASDRIGMDRTIPDTRHSK